MKEFNRVILFGFLLVLIAGCSKLEIQPDPLNSSDESALKSSKSSEHERPFIVQRSYGPFWIIPGGGDCDPAGDYSKGQVLITGEGNATHLGKFAIVNTYCFDFNSGDRTSWYGTMTAANGDELHTNIPDPQGGSIWIENGVTYYEYTIMGGNGRFENASGTIVMWGTTTFDPDDPLTGTWEMEGAGTIFY